MDNYFERIDFTKIEIILLLGVVLVLSPFLLSPLEYDITKFEEFSDKKLLEKKDFMDAKKIYKTEFVATDSVNRYENAQKLVLAKFFEDIVIDKEKAKFYENVEIKKEKHKIKTEIEKNLSKLILDKLSYSDRLKYEIAIKQFYKNKSLIEKCKFFVRNKIFNLLPISVSNQLVSFYWYWRKKNS